MARPLDNPPPSVRILADDLTGALDTAARFLPLAKPLPAYWKPPRAALLGPAAIDTETRELAESAAYRATRSLSALLPDAAIAFKKLDSLLRGNPAAEIRACISLFDHCIIAPAFPFQGRVTRDGRQLLRVGDEWRDTGVDLVAELSRRGINAAVCRPGDPVPPAVSFWNAETDFDLLAIAAAGRQLDGRVLWCGTGGLAGALADGFSPPPPPLPRPILALIGSGHPASTAQLSAAWAHVHRLSRGDADQSAPVARRLSQSGAAAVAVSVPPGCNREQARQHIEHCFSALVEELDPPGSLLVSGGETLRLLCDILQADYLEVDGEIVPGVPTSVLCGGPWNGICVISKSGAFGDPGLLLRLLHTE